MPDLFHSGKGNDHTKLYQLPLNRLLVVPFVVQIFATAGLIGYLSFRNSQKAINDLVSQLQLEASQRIDQHLDNYMAMPRQAVQIHTEAISQGLLDIQNDELVGKFFWNHLQSFDIGYMISGLETGQYLAMGHFFGDDRITIDRVAPVEEKEPNLYIWATDDQGKRTHIVHDRGKFIPKEEGWYTAAVGQSKGVWSPVYNWLVEPFNLSIAFSHPIYDENHNLIGVIAAEQGLEQVSDFLRQLKVSPSGQAFIIERNGLLIASSDDATSPFTVVNHQPQRLAAVDSSDPLVRTTANHLIQQVGQLINIQTVQQLEFWLDGQRQLIQVTPWRDSSGLDWLMVVVVPEADFMGQINKNTRSTILLSLLALLFTTALGIYASYRISRPILKLGEASDALATSARNGLIQSGIDYAPQGFHIREIRVLAQSFNRMAEQLQSSFDKLQYAATHDLLTALPNRATLNLTLQGLIKTSRAVANNLDMEQPQSKFAVLFLDLDYFKLVNDSLGHLAGDQLLITVAERLRTCIGSKDLVTRFGGDEFVILLQAIDSINDVVQVAEQILERIQRPCDVNGHEVFIGTSIGIALSTNGGESPEYILRNADIALYRAKANGKSSYEVFDEAMHTEVLTRLELEADLRRAIEREEFELYYQPIIDIKTQEISGLEVLLRWRHPTQGLLSPEKFIMVAEETNLIIKIGGWVLRQACHQMKKWQQQFPEFEALILHVNLSSQHFLQVDLLEQIDGIVLATGLNRRNLGLEITESLLMNHDEPTKSKLKRLSDSGVCLSIDDFGTGYSSFSYLHLFPIHTLKIDRSFVNQLQEPQGENLAIVNAIVVMAHELGMNVVAEGVETVIQLEHLISIGCQQAQGYLFSPPIASCQIPDLFADILNARDSNAPRPY